MVNKKTLSSISFWFSIAALVLAAVVSVFKMNLWLAGTQWILISILSGIYAIYFSSQE